MGQVIAAAIAALAGLWYLGAQAEANAGTGPIGSPGGAAPKAGSPTDSEPPPILTTQLATAPAAASSILALDPLSAYTPPSGLAADILGETSPLPIIEPPPTIAESKLALPELIPVQYAENSLPVGGLYADAPPEAFVNLPEIFSEEIKALPLDPTLGYHANIQAPVDIGASELVLPVTIDPVRLPNPDGTPLTPEVGITTYIPPTEFKADAPASWVNATDFVPDAFTYYANLFLQSIGLPPTAQ